MRSALSQLRKQSICPVDSNGAHQAANHLLGTGKLNTSRGGTFTYAVSAVSADGQSSTQQIA